jgi:hypothetical protein
MFDDLKVFSFEDLGGVTPTILGEGGRVGVGELITILHKLICCWKKNQKRKKKERGGFIILLSKTKGGKNECRKNEKLDLLNVLIGKVTLCFTPLSPLSVVYLQSNEILLNLSMKCWNSAYNAEGSRVIIVVVQVGAVKIYVATVKALRKERMKVARVNQPPMSPPVGRSVHRMGCVFSSASLPYYVNQHSTKINLFLAADLWPFSFLLLIFSQLLSPNYPLTLLPY